MWSTPEFRPVTTATLALLLGICRLTQAAEPGFTFNTAPHFGRIINLTNSSCSLDASNGTLTGDACLDSGGTYGEVEIQADANQSYNITLFPPASATNNLRFQPLLSNGTSSDTITTGADGRIQLNIGGIITSGASAPAPASQIDFTYTIRLDSN